MERVVIYIKSTEDAARKYDEYLSQITEKRKYTILHCKNDNDRNASLIAGHLLYKYLNVRDDKDLEMGPYGKLYLKSNKYFFNISHCDSYVSLAIANNEVGVDIEPITSVSYFKTIPSNVFNQEEIEWFNNHNEEEAFAWLWTRKEAVLKLDGQGFYKDPKAFSVLASDDYYIKSFCVHNCVISCAMKNDFLVELIDI